MATRFIKFKVTGQLNINAKLLIKKTKFWLEKKNEFEHNTVELVIHDGG